MPHEVRALERLITEHLSDWESAFVELAIYGTDDAAAIARALDDLCESALRARVARGLFYQSSIGAVAGIELVDGRRVVIKAHQPDVSRARLVETVRLQNLVRYAPPVLAGPLLLARGHAVVEAYLERGKPADAHEPDIRRALARSLFEVVQTLLPFAAQSSLPAQLTYGAGALWPKTHSRLFDFEKTARGAENIDALAAAARERMQPSGQIVLGHGDWRAEHVHFEGNEPVAAYDWDSLCKEPEPALVGCAAHAFCANWSRTGHRQAPSLDEARAFVDDYESARGQRFDADERRLCAACFAYSVAYTARCGHAIGEDHGFQDLVARQGRRLMEL
jgi:hypothetical protein